MSDQVAINECFTELRDPDTTESRLKSLCHHCIIAICLCGEDEMETHNYNYKDVSKWFNLLVHILADARLVDRTEIYSRINSML